MVTRRLFTSATNNTIIAAAAYLAGYYFTQLFQSDNVYLGGLWAVISRVIVLEDS